MLVILKLGSKHSLVFYTPSELSIGIKVDYTLLDFYILSVILDPTMDKSQFLNAPPFFDGSNYAFSKVRMCILMLY